MFVKADRCAQHKTSRMKPWDELLRHRRGVALVFFSGSTHSYVLSVTTVYTDS